MARRSPIARSATAPALALMTAIALAVGACDRSPSTRPVGTSDGAPAPAAESAPAPSVAEVEALRTSAERLLDGVNPADALTLTERLTRIRPDDWTAFELHGRALMAVALDGEERGVSVDRVQALRRAGAEAYEHAAHRSGSEAPHATGALWRTAALLHEATGAMVKADDCYERAALADPLDPQTPLFASQAHLRSGRLAEAKVLIDRVIALDPDGPWGWATLAELEWQSEDAASALAAIRHARRLDPANGVLRLREARLLRLMDRAEDALTLLLALPEAERLDAPFIEEVANAWRATGNVARGAAAWSGLATRHPQRWRYALEASRWWLEAGDPIRAGAALEPALLHAPDDPEVHEQRSAIGARIGPM